MAITSYDVIVTENEVRITSVFSARCNSRLCYDASVHLSVCDGSELAHYS